MGSVRREWAIRWAALILSLVGLFDTAVLTIAHGRHRDVPCGPAAGCESVLTDRWSVVLGVPLAAWGFLGYAILWLIAAHRIVFPHRHTSQLRRLGMSIACVGMVVSIVLTSYSVFRLRTYCPWCVASGVAMCLSFSAYALSGEGRLGRGTVRNTVLALGMTLYTAIGVGLFSSAATSDRRDGLDRFDLNGVQLATLVPNDGRRIGPPLARTTYVVFFDPRCPSCADAESLLTEAAERRDAVAVAFRYFPWGFHDGSFDLCVLLELYAESGDLPRALKVVSGTGAATTLESAIESLHPTNQLLTRLKAPDDPARRKVAEDVALARRLGVDRTPTIIEIEDDRRRQVTLQFVRERLAGQPYRP